MIQTGNRRYFSFRSVPGMVTLLVYLLLSAYTHQAQTISQAEYFFDTDPGSGNGIPIVISSPADTVTFTATISTAGLPGGHHYLFVRTRTSNGFWSLYEPQEFYVRAAVVQSEYFFDTDPGPGNGTPVVIGAGSDTVNFNATLSTAGLPVGEHKVFIRTRDEKGFWSLYEMREFYIRNPVVTAEYFFDTDPGVGNGTPLVIGAASDTVNFNAIVNTAGLPVGEHRLFVRTRDELGFWSLYEMRDFYVRNPLIKAEYFFDTDPGLGNGTPLVLGVVSDTVNFNAIINTTGVPPGEHKVFIRTQDELNFWSLYEMRDFYVKTSIVAAEFFIDTDPGLGNGTALVVTPTLDSISFSSVINTPVLPLGTHVLFVRTKDTFGNWSLYEPDSFIVSDSPLPIELISFDAIKIDDGKVKTSWQTAQEYNSDFFTVEKSSTGQHFEPFAIVDGAGSSSSVLNYEAIDHFPYEQVSYYRLKQTDFDGKHTFSKIIAVRFIGSELTLILYPNPNKGEFVVSVSRMKTERIELKIISTNGDCVYATGFDAIAGENNWNVFTPDLASGLYLVQIRAGESYGSHKFFIE